MPSIQEQLILTMQLGAMSVAELAFWLDCPRPTLVVWLQGAEPRPINKVKVERRLEALHRAMTQSPHPFIPENLTQRRRKSFLNVKKGEFLKGGGSDV
jgi:hypothetical protein